MSSSWTSPDGPFLFEAAEVTRKDTGTEVAVGYRVGEVSFVERFDLPVVIARRSDTERLVHLLHLVAGVSYYKLVAPRPMATPPLDPAARRLVEALYDRGLREFGYRNGITLPLPVEIREDDTVGSVRWFGPEPASVAGEGEPPAALIPIGGGKDSALVAHMVPDGRLFAVNPTGAHQHLAEYFGRPLSSAQRHLDPALREANEAGAPNGHVPVTAITSVVACLTARAMEIPDVLMGIERSADEPTVVTPDGVEVNHQFSKSLEAERLLADAVAPAGIRYLSLLRPLSELAIGTAVAQRGLVPHIVSCNRVFTIWNENEASQEQRPCGSCAKCLFTALMLAPGSKPAEIADRFGGALLDRRENLAAVRDLWSIQKPFDCVGERAETAAAVVLLSQIPQWADQTIIAALAAECRSIVNDAGVDIGSFFEVATDGSLPVEYRPALDDVARGLRSISNGEHAPR